MEAREQIIISAELSGYCRVKIYGGYSAGIEEDIEGELKLGRPDTPTGRLDSAPEQSPIQTRSRTC